MSASLPANLDAPLRYVTFASLPSAFEDPARFARCCTREGCNGLMLVRRSDWGVLEPLDRCVLCGQQVCYADIAAMRAEEGFRL